MAPKRTAQGKAAKAKPAAGGAKKVGRRAGPRVAVDGDLNPDHCYYDPAKGTMVLGLDVFTGSEWETVLVKFGLLLPDEVGWLDQALDAARVAIADRGSGGGPTPAAPDR